MLQKILKNFRKPLIGQKISYELCKSLIMLRDTHISGKINVSVVPLVIHLVQYWRVSWYRKFTILRKIFQNITNFYRWPSRNLINVTAATKRLVTT